MKSTSRGWWGGIVAGLACWGFSTTDVVAHHGTIDPTSAILIGIGGLFFAIPRINTLRASIPLPGRPVEVSINEFKEVVAAADAASSLATRAGDTAEGASRLVETWLRELDALFASLEATAPDRATYARAIFRYVNTRLEDISTWVGGKGEDVRAMLWWWSEPDRGACIVAAPRVGDQETLEHVFHPGEGILGRVLLDGDIANVADAPAELEWQRIALSAPRYHGLLCVPVFVRGRVAGVLTVDRVNAQRFGDDSVRFVRQVVALIKMAAIHTAVPSDVFSLPLPPAIAEDSPPAPDSL
ncbi:MAG: GAF domain-containing protein [Candidatus Eremiobacteraeota bacterium]|nr:GAF domain-containing protein [Candidatus Eremiobacteraeota bacterium]